MNSELRRRVRIGSRSVQFLCADLSGLEHHVLAIWDPAPPKRWKQGQLAKYRAERDAFMAELDEAIGCKAIVLDKMDLEGVAVLNQAGEVLLAAKAAGVTCTADGGEIRYHGDPVLVAVWEPVVRPHAKGVAVWLAAQRKPA